MIEAPELELIMMGFVFTQLTMAVICLFLFLLRITTLLKNKKTGFYHLSGTIQTGLCLIDLLLILFSQSVIKSSLMIFVGLNAGMAIIIFFDIYKSPHGKGNLAGTPGSQTTALKNNGSGK